MIIALPIWNDRIAPLFDVARQALIVSVHQQGIEEQTRIALPVDAPEEKVRCLVRQGTGILVCGAISRPLCLMACSCGIDVYAFVAGEAQEIIAAWFEGRLDQDDYAMPGCAARRRKFRARQNQQPDQIARCRGRETLQFKTA